MGLFAPKDPAAEYLKNKQAYLSAASVKKPSDDVYLKTYKSMQMGDIARINVQVMDGCLKIGDLMEITYKVGNKLGVTNVTVPVKAIYQIMKAGSFGKPDELAPASEAYRNDMVWVDLPGVDVSLLYPTDTIRRSKAKNTSIPPAASPASGAAENTVSVSYDEEVSQMVNYFKYELYGYFARRLPSLHVTQDLGYSLTAQKKRLDHMGITMAIEKSQDVGAASIRMEVSRYSSSLYDVAEANEPVKLRRTYYHPSTGRIVYRDEDWRICHYLLAGSKFNNDGLISCPSCGNYAPREELLTGCPYCNTQFQIKDLSLRVAGYSQKKIFPTNGKIDIGYALYHESKQKEYDQVLKHRMVQVDPLFSPTAFYNSMRNKLYSVVFAENILALRNLADEDFNIDPFFDLYKDVIDIDILGIETKEFNRNDPYMLLDVVMDTMVLHYQPYGDTAGWSREKITLSFVKNIRNKTKNIFEPSKVQCPGCGGSYSLYDGKACTFCGNQIDYTLHDWLLVDLNDERVF